MLIAKRVWARPQSPVRAAGRERWTAQRAPAATLRRLQDGGSPDNSGAAGKSHFTFFPSLLIVPCAFYWEHITLAPSLSFDDLSAHILPRAVDDGEVMWWTASGPFVRSLPESTWLRCDWQRLAWALARWRLLGVLGTGCILSLNTSDSLPHKPHRYALDTPGRRFCCLVLIRARHLKRFRWPPSCHM